MNTTFIASETQLICSSERGRGNIDTESLLGGRGISPEPPNAPASNDPGEDRVSVLSPLASVSVVTGFDVSVAVETTS